MFLVLICNNLLSEPPQTSKISHYLVMTYVHLLNFAFVTVEENNGP